MGVKIWSLALRLRMLKNKVLRNAFEPKRDEETGTGGDRTFRNFVFCTSHHISFGWPNKEE